MREPKFPIAGEELRYRTQLRVFGSDRMAEILEHEASSEVAMELAMAVAEACVDEPVHDSFGTSSRMLSDENGHQFSVRMNPQQVTGFGDSASDRGIITVYNLKSGKTESPKDLPRFHRYSYVEDLFLDCNGRAYVERAIWARTARISSISAVKPATEAEVQSALQTVRSAANRG